MAISGRSALIDLLALEMGASVALISDESYERIADKTLAELKWSYPLNDSFKEFWLVERARRHAIYLLYIESAQKFKYKQISLNQRFDHYAAIIKQMDADFVKATDDYPTMFPGVDTTMGFIQHIGHGFEYDRLGNDISDDVNEISGES